MALGLGLGFPGWQSEEVFFCRGLCLVGRRVGQNRLDTDDPFCVWSKHFCRGGSSGVSGITSMRCRIHGRCCNLYGLLGFCFFDGRQHTHTPTHTHMPFVIFFPGILFRENFMSTFLHNSIDLPSYPILFLPPTIPTTPTSRTRPPSALPHRRRVVAAERRGRQGGR